MKKTVLQNSRKWPYPMMILFVLGFLFSNCDTPIDIPIIQVYQTFQAGDQLKLITESTIRSPKVNPQKLDLLIKPEQQYQEYIGFGASFTESSAWNLATLSDSLRSKVLRRLFHPKEGAGFTLMRTHINSSDYSNGHYSYVSPGDTSLSSFSIYEDIKGFTGDENEQVSGIDLKASNYDLIPMIQEALNIDQADLKIIASPWSPPSWMKTGESSEMTNGRLQRKYYGLWARYLSKYISAYADQAIDIWGITPQNEPLHAHDARWDSNGFTAEQARDFLRDHLGPQLVKDGHVFLDDLNKGVRILIHDHNKSNMNAYVKVSYQDPEAAKYAWGTAFHWYASSKLEENQWYADALDTLRTNWPNKGMIHTESSIDIDANDPIGQYWRESTDYAGTFVPFDTYAFDIITDLNHGTQGYIEWCMILSHKGQPNPYDNFNSAPVLINPNTSEISYTPLYYLLSHFSKYIRPGAHRIAIEGNELDGLVYTAAENEDGSVVVVVFNRNNHTIDLNLRLQTQSHKVQLDPRAIQTIYFKKRSKEYIK